VAELEPDVLEVDFCLLERAGTRATLNETVEMDDEGQLRTGHGMRPPLPVRTDGAAADRGLKI
jgi:hypothetical protein